MLNNLEQLTWGSKVNYKVLVWLQHYKLTSEKNISSKLVGSRLSKKWGSGLEFDQLREYSFGDDPRFIDWKASSRLDTLYTKQFIEDKDANYLIVVDIQDSMYFGSKKRLLSTLACYSAAVLAWKWQKVGYAVALSIISSHKVIDYKPTHQKAQLQKQLYHMVQLHNVNNPSQNKSVLENHINLKMWQKFDHIAVFTHVLAINETLIKTLAHKYKGKKILLIALEDPLLTIAPKSGWISDGEQTKSWLELLDKKGIKQLIKENIRQALTYGLVTDRLNTQASITDIVEAMRRV